MDIFVANFSDRPDELIHQWLVDFQDYLAINGIDIDMKIQYCSDQVKDEILQLNESVKAPDFLCQTLEDLVEKYFLIQIKEGSMPAEVSLIPKHLLKLLDESFSMDFRLVVLGKGLKLRALWGDAKGFCTVIGCVQEKVVWHEVAHLLGAKDHYDNDRKTTPNCRADNCIMQYGLTEGILCEQSLMEMIQAKKW